VRPAEQQRAVLQLRIQRLWLGVANAIVDGLQRRDPTADAPGRDVSDLNTVGGYGGVDSALCSQRI
jgi:hypothetical protein